MPCFRRATWTWPSCGPKQVPTEPRSFSTASPRTRRWRWPRVLSTRAARSPTSAAAAARYRSRWGGCPPGAPLSSAGRGAGTLPVALGSLPPECSVTIPTWGTLAELVEVVALARSGAIHIETERLSLDEAVDGYRRLGRGDVVGRAVVSPSA